MSRWTAGALTAVVVGVVAALGWFGLAGEEGPQVATTERYDFSKVDDAVAELMETYEVEGASMKVMRHGELIYDRSWGTFTEDTDVTVGSATKWMSVAVIMKLVEDGVLSLDDTIGEYFGDFPPEQQGITLHQLLSHTHGMKRRTDCVNDYQLALQDCVRTIGTEPLRDPVGSVFRYGGVSVHVAAGMAEVATGKPWRQLFQEILVEPLGLTHTQYGVHAVSENPGIGGNIRTTARDFSRFLTMIHDEGRFEGRQVLAPETVALMESGHTGTVPREGHLPKRHLHTPHDLYGYGVWRDVVDVRGEAVVVSAPGKFGTAPWIDRELGVAGIFLVEIQNGGDVAAARPDPAGIQYVVCDAIDRAENGPRDDEGPNPRCGIKQRREAAARAEEAP
jgi:CubicO group peptidase (beta-lactamase class C family)